MYTAEQISDACQVPLAAAQANWPLLTAAMREFAVWTPGTAIAIAANVAEETAHTFEPIEEYGDQSYFMRELGAEEWWFHGRGFNQETWSSGYAWAAQATGIDCLRHPELLLIAANSARVTAAFVKMKGIPAQAEAHNWTEVRRLWNGGSNGLEVVLGHVTALLALPYPPDDPPPAPPLAGRILHVVTALALKTAPNHACPAAIDPHHQHVKLAVGMTVKATGKTHTEAGETWYEVQVLASPVHGWFLESAMRA